MKKCKHCGKVKKYEEFYYDKNGHYRATCKLCVKVKNSVKADKPKDISKKEAEKEEELMLIIEKHKKNPMYQRWV